MYVHEIKAEGVRSYQDGAALLHNTAYYTLNRIPAGAKLDVPRRTKTAVKEEAEEAPSMPAHSGHDMKDMPKNAAMAVPAKPAGEPAPAATKPLAKRQTKKPDDWDKVDQTITIGTLPGLKYNKTYVSVKTGSRVKWTFSNNDDMPHNCVVVKPGKADEVGTSAMNLGLKGQEMNYVPKTANVLFHTRLTGPGASDSIYFVAPAPGDYTFVCTVPGHAQIMRGVLHVTK
jgi:azurin